MILLRKLSEFGAPKDDFKIIYVSYIRSILEQSAVVWHFSLTEENKQDLERVQKTYVKIILKERYKDYNSALDILDLEDLNTRRDRLCQKFAKQSAKNGTLNFEINNKLHNIKTRNAGNFKISFCHTERSKKSSIPQMQRMLNRTS